MDALLDVLAQTLVKRFPGHELRLEEGPPRSIVLPAVCPDGGDAKIFDDGDEFTVVFGKLGHEHYGEFQYPVRTEKDRLNLEEAIDRLAGDLTALFFDALVIWGGSVQHMRRRR